MKNLMRITAGLVLGATLVASEAVKAEGCNKKDIVDTALAAGSFKTLAAALGAANLVTTLKGEGPFTVFAPTDEAFAKLPAGTVEALLNDIPTLTKILTYHVTGGALSPKQLIKGKNVATVQGQSVSATEVNGKLFINDSKVLMKPIQTSNGVIYVIDSVLLPKEEPKLLDIVDTAVAAGSFKTLVAAVAAAGLVDTLKSEGPFTVFAPTDEAFAKLGKTVNELLKPENKQMLTKILLYHVVSGKVLAEQAVKLTQANTVAGEKLSLKVTNGNLFINSSKVIAADVAASNGVIHVIDSVLIP